MSTGVWFVVPAAGVGSRMGGGPGAPAKQFRSLGGAPVLVRTLHALAPEASGGIVVAVGEHEVEGVQALLSEPLSAVRVVVGGASRQASVARGVAATPEAAGVVLVHDAVRPFVTREAVRAVTAAVRETGAAALAVPVADTLRRAAADTASGEGPADSSARGRFAETVDRAGLWRMQTPQGARRDLLARALAQAAADGLDATDEVGALQHAGIPVALVPGDERNIKLTRPADWALAEALWAQRERAAREGAARGGAGRES